MPCEGVVGLTCAYIDAEGHICVALEGGKSSPLESLSDLDVGVRQESAGHIVAEGSQREVFRGLPRHRAIERCCIVIDRILVERNACIGTPIVAELLVHARIGRSKISEHQIACIKMRAIHIPRAPTG